MFKFILSSLYFFLPAYIANMTPPLAKKVGVLKSFDKPVDGNRKIQGKPILGSHKTWRGLICGITMGVLTALFQSWLYRFPSIQKLSLLNYREINAPFLGLLMASGGLTGDMFFSFLKRRLNLKPGAKFLPFDQVNYVIGAALFLTPFLEIDILVWLTLMFLTFFLHIVFNRLGYHLNLHQARW